MIPYFLMVWYTAVYVNIDFFFKYVDKNHFFRELIIFCD
jgi:hypothetical protein